MYSKVLALLMALTVTGCHQGKRANTRDSLDQTSGAEGSDEPGDDDGSDGQGGGDAKSFPQGLYAGSLSVPSSNVKLAAEAYLYAVQGPEVEDFPKLNVLLKVQLGGYNSTEYVTEQYSDVFYSFEQGDITLDHPDANIVFNGKAQVVDGKKHLVGTVKVKHSPVAGTLDVEFKSKDECGPREPDGGDDEPGDDDGGGSDEPGGDGGGGSDEPGGNVSAASDQAGNGSSLIGSADGPTQTNSVAAGSDSLASFLPRLMGEYSGQCNGVPALLQIETGRGVADDPVEVPTALMDYRISGRLALQSPTCTGDYCLVRHYDSGGYDFFNGTLTLRSDVADDSCTLRDGHLSCTASIEGVAETCQFALAPSAPREFQLFARSNHVAPTAEEQKPVPSTTPPVSPEAIGVLTGQFRGYLHNERRDTYQRFELETQATISSVNPHNNDVSYVTASASIYFGREASKTRYVQKLDRRPFIITSGFTLDSEESDGFLIGQQWKAGYICGIWVSKSSGRVGTVELVKERMPELPDDAATVADPAGSFQGQVAGVEWMVAIMTSTQMRHPDTGVLEFQGTYRDSDGLTRRKQITFGAFDLYSGAIAWHSDEPENRMIVGSLGRERRLGLIWPAASVWGNRVGNGLREVPFSPANPIQIIP